MPTDSAVIDKIRPLGAIFRARDAVEHGISWRDLYQVRDSGLLIEVSRGLFQLREAAGIDQIDFVVVCARAPQGVVCLGSVLAHWDLSDETPTRVDLAVPAGSHRPQIDYPPTRVHVFGASNFGFGRIEVAVGQDSVFASLTPKGLSSTVSVGDIALGRPRRRWLAPLPPPSAIPTRPRPRTGRAAARRTLILEAMRLQE